MVDKDRVATYYINARELIKQNNPKAARAYVLVLLNNALETYQNAKSILIKAKTQAFMDRWIAVSRDLHEKGITDYVLECFGLPSKQEQELPKVDAGKSKKPDKKPQSPPQKPQEPAVKEPAVKEPVYDGGIDISGLIEETAKTQGWCAEVFERNKNAVVGIDVSGTGSSASGTGFIISQNGYLLTNDHVVFDENTNCYYPRARMSFCGRKKTYKIKVLFSDRDADVALCSFVPEDVGEFSAVKRVSDYSQIKQGADCLIVGNAFGMGLAPFAGVVRFTRNDEGNLVYTAPSNPGDSGGPVFNRQGECIGINKSKTVSVNGSTAEGYANATPMDKIQQLLDKWTKANNIEL